MCVPCRLTTRLDTVLDDGSGTPNPALAPLAAHLLVSPRPLAALQTLYKRHTVALLSALATGRIPLTHEGLHAWPHPTAAQHLRHRLITCGVLPPIDRHLAAIEAWLHRRLASLAEHPHERLLRRFALWHHLPRLGATAAARPLRANAKQYLTQQFTQAQLFRSWLHEHRIAPEQVAQADIDTWYVDHRVHQRHNVRGFILWATDHGHLPRQLVAPRVAFRPGTTITQQRRLDLIRQYLTDETAPASTRAAACLPLLYAQPLSRIHRLSVDDLMDDGELQIRLGDPPSPIPEPFASLLRRLTPDADQHTRGWLFPGKLAGQPIAYGTLRRRLRALGFPLIDARVAALRQLVQQAPAPVVADALGFHHTTTTRQVAHAGVTWSRYAPADHRR